ncbi:DUF4129 domain-containing protein [Paenibacillus paeoniae]|uniref:DUF4129 domain-containing protein n=1 Tax=Paenibacillus paeoniae TaxID=2292705 RepID=A0A371PLK0_9BACL|nr:DUF4129 domain-containing protein [Paenibacillus paeoniae]REK77084.1 DUF4129 domain-containing protein [Paenibacillus paeoniae]
MTSTARVSLWRIVLKGYIELLFYLPILLTLTILLLPSQTLNVWLATLPIVYCAPLAMLGSHSRIRFMMSLLLVLVLVFAHGAAVVLLTGAGLTPVTLVTVTLFGIFFAYRGFQHINLGWNISFDTIHMVTGIMAYVATQVLKMVLVQPLKDYTFILNTGIIASIFLLFIIMNERHVTKEVVDHRQSLALRATRKQNRIWIAALIALLGIVMAFAQLRHGIESLIHFILRWLLALIGTGEPAPPPPAEEESPGPFMLPEVDMEGFAFWNYLGIFIVIIIVILMTASLIVMIKKFGRTIIAMINKLLKRRVVQPDTGYVDEIENLMTFSDMRNRMRDRLRSLFGSKGSRGDEWNTLATNRERVRYLYRTWLTAETKRGYTPQPHLTPRETAADIGDKAKGQRPDEEWIEPFIGQYEDTRYGDKEPDDEQVLQYRTKLQPKKNKK